MGVSQAGRRRFESGRPLLTEPLSRTRLKRTHLRRMARHRNPNCAENFRRKGLPVARTLNHLPPPYPKKPHNGQARITVRTTGGRRKDLLLGPHGSPESRTEYRRVLAELEAHGGLYPVQ